MGRGIPRGIGFGIPDACECFQYAPDAGSTDILKKTQRPEVLISPRNGFRKDDAFIVLKQQNAKTEMTARATRRYHVFIRIAFCDGICKSNYVFHEHSDFRFLYG